MERIVYSILLSIGNGVDGDKAKEGSTVHVFCAQALVTSTLNPFLQRIGAHGTLLMQERRVTI